MPVEVPSAAEVRAIVREELARALEPIRRALPPSLVSIEEAAGILGVSVATVRRRVKAREWPTKRVGRQIKIDATALHAVRELDLMELTARRR